MSRPYEAVIGLEIHVQLATKSKMFCRCDNDSEGATPNQHTCPVCLGMPGTLPVPNRQAIEWALKAAMALGCEIPKQSKFDRKQYFYPDLPKGYQISQYDQPFGGPGSFAFDMPDGTARTIRITRLHLEEDAGKLTHPPGAPHSLVDLNRAGTPLMEIVTEPDFQSPEETKVFLQELRLVMRHLGVSDADMEKGHLRADANVSLRPAGTEQLGTKTELKNLNSFKFVEKGLTAEIKRQTQVLESGDAVAQETRGFNEDKGTTQSQRGKEEAHDYRYFPEPDIPPVEPPSLGLAELKAGLPELPVAQKRRWRKAGVPAEAVAVAGSDPDELAAFAKALGAEELAAPTAGRLWLMLRADEQLAAAGFAKLSAFVSEAAPLLQEAGLTGPQTKQLAARFADGHGSVSELLEDPAFQPVDADRIDQALDRALAANPEAAADFKGGNENALNVILGFVMKETKGSANPTTVKERLRSKLE